MTFAKFLIWLDENIVNPISGKTRRQEIETQAGIGGRFPSDFCVAYKRLIRKAIKKFKRGNFCAEN